MNESHSHSLKSLTPASSLVVLLRALYRMVLDYGVLATFGDPVVFTKDQLVSLIERSSTEILIEDIPKMAAQGFFKPAAPENGFPESEQLQVLLIEEDGASVSSMKDALTPREPDYPEWWEAPLPLAMRNRRKLYINRTSMLMFGSDLTRLPVYDLPEKDEFLVELEGRERPCLLMFRRLEPDIFILEDCTGDAVAAEDITWWAAIGKAWVSALNGEKRRSWRSDKGDLDGEKYAVLPCEWEGTLLGYFCVEQPKGTPKSTGTFDPSKAKPSSKIRKGRSAPASLTPKQAGLKKENETLAALGPQAMGLLAPGSGFNVPEERQEAPVSKTGRKAKTKVTETTNA